MIHIHKDECRMTIVKVLMCLVLVTSFLSSCELGHNHTFSEEWMSDETYHWHAATCEHKNETYAKWVHNWNDMVIEIEPTLDKEGLGKISCKVCLYEKTVVLDKASYKNLLVAQNTSYEINEETGLLSLVDTCDVGNVFEWRINKVKNTVYYSSREEDNIRIYSISPFTGKFKSIGTMEYPLGYYNNYPYSMAFSKDGSYMYLVGFRNNNVTNAMEYFFFKAILSANGMIEGFEEIVLPDDIPHSGNVQSMEVSPDGKYLYLVEYNYHRIHQFEIQNNGDLKYMETCATCNSSPTSLVFSKDGKTVYVANGTCIEIFEYGIDSGTLTQKGIAYTGSVDLAANYPLKITISNDGCHLYCGVDKACVSYSIDSETGLLTHNGKYPPNKKTSYDHGYVATSNNASFVYTSDGYIYKQNEDGSLSIISQNGCNKEMDCIFPPIG